MGQLKRSDGGLATTLQRLGLPPHTPVDDWVLTKPETVEGAQRRFVDAGAQVLLTATFRALPGVTDQWRAVIDGAVDIALRAADGRAEVWGSIGPSGKDWSTLNGPERQALAEGWALVAQRMAPRVSGLVLETFTDPREAGDALFAVRSAAPDCQVVVSLTPRPDGRLFDGSEPGPVLAALKASGADYLGFNCGQGPDGVLAAVERCTHRDLWVRPAGTADDPRSLATRLAPWLRRCAVIGGCCGADPHAIHALGDLLA